MCCSRLCFWNSHCTLPKPAPRLIFCLESLLCPSKTRAVFVCAFGIHIAPSKSSTGINLLFGIAPLSFQNPYSNRQRLWIPHRILPIYLLKNLYLAMAKQRLIVAQTSRNKLRLKLIFPIAFSRGYTLEVSTCISVILTDILPHGLCLVNP